MQNTTFPSPGFDIAPPGKELSASCSYSFCCDAFYNQAGTRGNVAWTFGYNARSESYTEPMFLEVLETHWRGQSEEKDAQFERYIEIRSPDRKTIRRPWGFVSRKHSDYIRHDLICHGIYWTDPITGKTIMFAQPYQGVGEFQFTGNVYISGTLHSPELTALRNQVAALEARLAKLEKP